MGPKRPNDGTILMMRPQGHDPSVPHSFNHTGGECPKCSAKNHHVVFCSPGQREVPKVIGCEVDGEHLHRQCGMCGYPWVERCYDHFLHSMEEGWTFAESQLLAALASIAHRAGGVTLDQAVISGYRGWTIRFTRDAERAAVTITAEETPPQGEPAHPELRPSHQGPQPRGRAS
jgi:hypothetical protein